MKYFIGLSFLAIVLILGSFTGKNNPIISKPFIDTVHFPGETHFANVRQLTFGGDNAEAYLSKDGKYLVFHPSHNLVF